MGRETWGCTDPVDIVRTWTQGLNQLVVGEELAIWSGLLDRVDTGRYSLKSW